MHVMRRGGRRKYHRCRALVCLVLLVVSILPFGQLLKKLSASFSIYAWKRFIGFGEDIDVHSLYVRSCCGFGEASTEQSWTLMEAYRRSKLHNDARKVSTAKAVIDYVTDHQDAEAEAEVNPKSRQSYEKFAAQRRRQPFIVLIDGVFFREGPTGIFLVWKNLIPELAKQFPKPSRLILLDRTPNSQISLYLGDQPHVERVTIANDGELDSTIRDVILGGYEDNNRGFWPFGGNGKKDDAIKPIVVFISTYYSYPELSGICNIIMYHDVIPEKVGLNFMPGTAYNPRIANLDRVDSIVAVSHSTARDIVELYGDRVTKRPGDAFFDVTPPRHVGDYLHNTIVSTTVNRVSRALFPGPADSLTIMEFRKRYRLWTAERPVYHGVSEVPMDYFALVGSPTCYKNHQSVFAAFDHLDDNQLQRVSLLVLGRGAPGSNEFNGITNHRVLVTEGIDDDMRETMHIPVGVISDVVIRVHVISHMRQEDMPTMYSNALALLYLASYEGFGLPLAEAMTSGTLGVTTNASSLPEVGGPSTITTYVNDPTDPLAIADGIMEILQLKFEERKQRVQNALKWVERYGGGGQGGIGKGWEAMAHEIAVHIRSSKHRGSHCYNSPWTPTVV